MMYPWEEAFRKEVKQNRKDIAALKVDKDALRQENTRLQKRVAELEAARAD